MGVPDGPTTAVHMLTSFLAPGDEIEPEAGLSVDVRNAFNTIDRAHVLRTFFACPSLAMANRLLHWSYSEPAPLWLRRRDGTLQGGVSSAQGVRQGDPLGSVAFAVAFHPILLETLKAVPVTVVALHDDATFIGSPVDVLEAARVFSGLASRVGLQLQRKKCALLWFCDSPVPPETQTHLADLGLPPTVERSRKKLLGIPVGRHGVTQAACAIVSGFKPIFDTLAATSLTRQERFLLLVTCVQAKVNYLARALPPDLSGPALTAFDCLVMRTAARITECLPLASFNHSPASQQNETLILQASIAGSLGG